MRQWQLQDAKARLSEVIRSAKDDGPQEITVRGEAAAVVMSRSTYEGLVAEQPPLAEFLRQSPLAETNVAIVRDRSLTREIDL